MPGIGIGIGLHRGNIIAKPRTMQFTSVQPTTKSQITFKYKIPTGKQIYINWGYGSDILLTADGTEKSIVSVFPTSSTTYNCCLTGDISYLQEFYIYNNTTVEIESSELVKFKRLEYLYLYYSSSDNNKLNINSSDLKQLTYLTSLTLRTLGLSSNFNTSDLIGLPLKYIDVQAAPTLANYRCNSLDLIDMPLEVVIFSANAGIFNFDTVDLRNKNITKFNITGYGSASIIRSEDLATMPLTDILIHGGFSACIINSSDFIGMSLTRLSIGHTGVNTIIRSSDVVQISGLTNFTLYGDGGVYDIDLSDFSAMSSLLTFYLNGQVSTITISGGYLSDLPTQLTTIFTSAITNLNITDGTMKAWTNATITLTNNHDSSDVDAFLIAWAPIAGTAAKTITIKKARTSASDSAVATLVSKLKTINTSN